MHAAPDDIGNLQLMCWLSREGRTAERSNGAVTRRPSSQDAPRPIECTRLPPRVAPRSACCSPCPSPAGAAGRPRVDAPRLLTTIAADPRAAAEWRVRLARARPRGRDLRRRRLGTPVRRGPGRRPRRRHQRHSPVLRARRSASRSPDGPPSRTSRRPLGHPTHHRTARHDAAAHAAPGAAVGADDHDVRRPQPADRGRGQRAVDLERLPAASRRDRATLG